MATTHKIEREDTDPPKINDGQPLSIMLDGKETLLFPDTAGNTYITFGDGTAAVHVAPGDEWVYIAESSWPSL